MRTDRSVRLTTMGFHRREVSLPPRGEHVYDPAERNDALVIVTAGVIELEGLSGRRWRLPCGAILWLTDLPVRALRSPGDKTAVLTTVSRRPMNCPSSTRPS